MLILWQWKIKKLKPKRPVGTFGLWEIVLGNKKETITSLANVKKETITKLP